MSTILRKSLKHPHTKTGFCIKYIVYFFITQALFIANSNFKFYRPVINTLYRPIGHMAFCFFISFILTAFFSASLWHTNKNITRNGWISTPILRNTRKIYSCDLNQFYCFYVHLYSFITDVDIFLRFEAVFIFVFNYFWRGQQWKWQKIRLKKCFRRYCVGNGCSDFDLMCLFCPRLLNWQIANVLPVSASPNLFLNCNLV